MFFRVSTPFCSDLAFYKDCFYLFYFVLRHHYWYMARNWTFGENSFLVSSERSETDLDLWVKTV